MIEVVNHAGRGEVQARRGLLRWGPVLGAVLAGLVLILLRDPGSMPSGLPQLAPVRGPDGAWGLVDLNGHVVHKPEYAALVMASPTNAIVTHDHKTWYLLGKSRTLLLSLEAERIGSLGEGLFSVTTSEGRTVYDSRSDQLHGPFKNAFLIRRGLLPVQLEENTGALFDREFQKVYQGREGLIIDPFYSGRARVFDRKARRFGFIDESFAAVIPTEFEFAQPFSEGLAFVVPDRSAERRFQLIDRQGRLVIQRSFNDVRAFHGGFGAIKEGGTWRFIDVNGRQLPGSYQWVGKIVSGRTVVREAKGERFKVWDNGQLKDLGLPAGEWASGIFGGFFWLATEGQAVLFNDKGKRLWSRELNEMDEVFRRVGVAEEVFNLNAGYLAIENPVHPVF